MRAKITIAAILGLALAGCASAPSEYNQGCRDGVTSFVNEGLHADIEKSAVDKGCDALDEVHQSQKNRPKGKAAQ